MRSRFSAAVLAGLLLLGPAAAVHADDAAPKSEAQAKKAIELPPFPADASVKQTTTVAGKTLNYTATVGHLPVRDADGKVIAEVVFTAYTLDGVHSPDRPVTFAFNGGPGAASVYLNLGAIGPKRIQFGAAGDSASEPARLSDNPGTWLDFTDLVFIDPVGTGFSRSLVSKEETKKDFYAVKPDIEYLSRVVYDWLLKNGRMASPKYVVGESYGGFRGPRITHYLQTQLGVGVTGVVLVSPYLDAGVDGSEGETISPYPYVVTLPSMAAAHYEREGKALTPAMMQEVENYARGEFAVDLLKGRSDKAALDSLVQHVTEYTGLDPQTVRRQGGRIESFAFLRQLYRDQGKIGSWYDSNVTAYDPFPWSPDRRSGDPILDSIIAPTTSAMVDFVTRTVGWKVDARYNALSGEVNQEWENGISNIQSVTDLRQALALDPHLKVLIAHGWDDLSCPYFASKLIVDQMPAMGEPGRISVHVYPGGHMFYSRPDSQAAFRHDVMALYGAH
jgi:carboxypeptidase C (cathepsin A)